MNLKIASVLLLSSTLAACVPAHVDCEYDYTVDYRFCNVKDTDGPSLVVKADKPVVDAPSQDKPKDDPKDPPKDYDHNGDDTNGDNSKSYDYNGDSSDDNGGKSDD